MEMAKAISANAGLAMAFRPDVLDRTRRDDLMEKALDYLQGIHSGVLSPAEAQKAMKFLLGGTLN